MLGPLTIVTLSGSRFPSGSVSFLRTMMWKAVFFFPVTLSLPATGAWLDGMGGALVVVVEPGAGGIPGVVVPDEGGEVVAGLLIRARDAVGEPKLSLEIRREGERLFRREHLTQGEGDDNQDGDSQSMRHDKVEIPDAEAGRGPAEFRKELLDAMKQAAPEKYKERVKQYYEELVK